MSSRPPNGEYVNARPAVIRQTPLSEGGRGPGFLMMLPAWIISAVIHGIILALFFLVTLTVAAGEDGAGKEEAVESQIDEPTPNEDLTMPDIGLTPEVDINYDVARKDEVSVPGAVLPQEVVGLSGGVQDASPQNVPPPPGLGNGQGGAIQALAPGLGSPIGQPGGYAGFLFSPGSFGARLASGATRDRMVAEGGGNKDSEAAVARALEWLALHQCANGSWSMEGHHLHARDKIGPGAKQFTCNCSGPGMKNDIAATAFGLLPFLAAGQTHKPSTSVKSAHDYTKTVENALKFLMLKQNKETGQLGGGMYEHGLATIALCEAYGLTADPGLKVHAQKALDFIRAAQHSAGGWRYGPKQAGDTSVVGWQVMALKSGQMSGLSVPKPVLDGAGKFLDSVMDKSNYGYGYTGPGSTPTLTAVGLLCRQYLGWSPRNPDLVKGVDFMKQTPPSPGNMYYSYYATQVMHHMGGEGWTKWNEGMRDALIRTQDKGTDPKRPHQRGSWDPKIDGHGGAWGRVGQTSLSVLTLEVYYRHLPLYRRELGTVKPD